MPGRCAEDLTGQIFGYLKVKSRAPNYIQTDKNNKKHFFTMWNCECLLCGNEKAVRASHLKSNKSLSCGCYRKQRTKEALTKHNSSKTKLYMVWRNIISRCYNQNVKCYKNYGGRGITMCDEWRNDFVSFQKWCNENGYDENAEHMQCQIDRIDNNGPYAPWNCRFVSAKENCANKRPAKLKYPELITVFNLSLTGFEWHKLLDISSYKLRKQSNHFKISISNYVLYIIERRAKAINLISKTKNYNAAETIQKINNIAVSLRLDKLSNDEFLSVINKWVEEFHNERAEKK